MRTPELNDPEDQRRRFEAQEKAFAAGDEEANHTDEDFLNALADRYASDRWYRIRYRSYGYDDDKFTGNQRCFIIPDDEES